MKTPNSTASLKNIVAVLSFLLLASTLSAQVGIGIVTPDPSAQLDITSSNKGLLVPRMTSTLRTGISSPATGLMVYQTDAPAGFYYFDGTVWNAIGGPLIGFSATAASQSVTATGNITTWTTTTPFYNTGGFDATTGQYTVPSTGTYAITATVNYKTLASISVSLGSSVSPYVEVKKLTPTASSLLQASLPILDVNIALILTLRAILGGGAVNIGGTMSLTSGDVIALGYNANSLGVGLNLGAGLPSGIVWTVTKIH